MDFLIVLSLMCREDKTTHVLILICWCHNHTNMMNKCFQFTTFTGILDYSKTNDNLVLCFVSSYVMISVSGCSVSFTAQSSVHILDCSVVYLSCHYLLSFGNFWKVLEAAELFTSTATKVHRVDNGMTNAFALW